MATMLTIDQETAIDRLLRLLGVEGTTGHEGAIAAAIKEELRAVGVPAKAIKVDKAHERIPLPTESGNVIVHLPGKLKGPHLLFSTHMDTVPLCAGAKPVRKGKKIIPEGKTALGGDDRTGVGCLITLAAELIQQKVPHLPITLLFTVREESGLFGARFVEVDDLVPNAKTGKPAMCFNVDGKSAATLCIGATGAQRWEVEIHGKASHAGVAPEKGVSATAVAALAMAEVYGNGWFGKVEKDGKSGTSNVGSVRGGDGKPAGNATNVVTDFVQVIGESRSFDPAFCKQITEAYKSAFQEAAKRVTDDEGNVARVKFSARLDYHPFRLKSDAPVIARVRQALESMGRQPEEIVATGGLDANWLVKHGIPTVTFGAGQNEIHTVKEFVDLNEYTAGCELAVLLATME